MSAEWRGSIARAFQLLLRLYPSWFRRSYGEEMTFVFLTRLGRARHFRQSVRIWWRTIGDAVVTAIALRRRRPEGDREHREGAGMDNLLRDIRYALRYLARSPGFTIGAVALLAIGMGANTAVFTVVDSMLFRPRPWERPEEVVAVYQDSDDGEPNSSSYPATRDMAQSNVFSAVAAISPSDATWESADGPVRVATEYVTASYLEVLGLSPSRGRWLAPEHDFVGAAPVAVISAAAWRSRLGAAADVVGRTIQLNGQPVTIIGVGPDQLAGTYSPVVTDFWLSISATVVEGDNRVGNLERRQDHWYDVRARLAPGVTVAAAQAAMDALAASLAEQYPDLNRGRDITVFAAAGIRQHPSEDGDMLLAGGMLSALAFTVLLLACANLANLLLARGLGRTGEVAVRRALGAGRGRVARIFVVESLILSVLGGALGLALARWTLLALPAMPIPWPMGGIVEFTMDGRVAAFSLALMLGTGILFGLAPALRSARTDVARVLRDERAAGHASRHTARLRGGLVAVQVAASLVLMVVTGLVARSLVSLQGVDTGIDADRIAFVRVDLTGTGLAGDESRVALAELIQRVSALPGVTGASAASRLPAQQRSTTTTVVEGYTPPTGTDAIELDFIVVADGYFEAMGIPHIGGRLFGDEDVLGGTTAILLNEAGAQRFWPGQEAVGRRLRAQTSETWRRTVGVVGDVPVASLSEPTRPIMYFTTRQATMTSPYLVARTDGAPEALLGPMRQAVESMRSTLTVTEQGTLASHFEAGLATSRFAAAVLGAFTILAVVLAGLGIYAVVSFSVARRTSEMGLRMALGAERTSVVRLVVGEIIGTVAIGMVIGLPLAALAASRLDGALYGVGGLDPATFGGALVFLGSVAFVAALLPAQRAARADPAHALRAS